MSPPEKIRIRAMKPKTRTGCKTCKIRKVKCDEGKPSCARCLRFGVDCQGYEVLQPKIKPSRGDLKVILPRTTRHSMLLHLPPQPLPFTAFVDNNRDHSYFQYFQEETALEIFGLFDGSLCNHVIIQASWMEPSLYRLVASIGALHKASSVRTLSLSADATDETDEPDLHRQYAFREYGRALKGVQALISTNQYQDTPRIALIASLLIYCFENLYGDIQSAIVHLENALELARRQLLPARRHYKHADNTSPISSLDDDLVVAFVRLDNGLLTRPNNDKPKDAYSGIITPSILDIDYQRHVCEVPVKFNSISEARSYLEHLQYPILPSLSYEFSLQMGSPASHPIIDADQRETYTNFSSQLRKWMVAFMPAYKEALRNPGDRNLVAAATLRVRALSSDIAAQYMCALGMPSPMLFVAECREIVELSKQIMAEPGFVKSFVWDCGIIPGLSIVIGACRDRSMQEEALEVLKQTVPRCEGVWDSLSLVAYGERFLEMDEDI